MAKTSPELNDLMRSITSLVVMSEFKSDLARKTGKPSPQVLTDTVLKLREEIVSLLKKLAAADPDFKVDLPTKAGIRMGTVPGMTLLDDREWDAKYPRKAAQGPEVPVLGQLSGYGLGFIPLIPVLWVVAVGFLSAGGFGVSYMLTAEGRAKQQSIQEAEAATRAIVDGINTGKIDPVTGKALLASVQQQIDTIAAQSTTAETVKSSIIIGILGLAAIIFLPKLLSQRQSIAARARAAVEQGRQVAQKFQQARAARAA